MAANVLFALSIAAGVPFTARKAWQAARLRTRADELARRAEQAAAALADAEDVP